MTAARAPRSRVAAAGLRHLGWVMSAGAVGFAAAAAICIALASAVQHQAAAEQGYRNGIQLLWRLARNRRWAAGLAAGLAGLFLHAAALHAGALAVVQPVLVTSVALALPVRACWTGPGRRPGRWPRRSRPAGLCSVIAARARSGRAAGFALGLAAGILYGLTGGALKAAVHAALHDPLAAVAGWPLWTLIVLGGWALMVHQRAYTRAPLRVALPLSVANPLAGMAFGVLAFGERPATGPVALTGEALGLAVIIAAVTMLARPGANAGSHRRQSRTWRRRAPSPGGGPGTLRPRRGDRPVTAAHLAVPLVRAAARRPAIG